MTQPGQGNPEQHARTLVAQLELISHAPAMNLEPHARSSEHPGGRRPPGAIDARDDFDPDYALKSHIHFQRRLARCHTDGQYQQLAQDAERTLAAWKHTPPPPRDSTPWQTLVANAPGTVRQVAEDWNLSAARVHQLRVQYRKVA